MLWRETCYRPQFLTKFATFWRLIVLLFASGYVPPKISRHLSYTLHTPKLNKHSELPNACHNVNPEQIFNSKQAQHCCHPVQWLFLKARECWGHQRWPHNWVGSEALSSPKLLEFEKERYRSYWPGQSGLVDDSFGRHLRQILANCELEAPFHLLLSNKFLILFWLPK